MVRPLTDIACPVCRRPRTSRQIRRANPRKLERYYECGQCGSEFTTIEQVARSPLESLRVQGPATPDNPNPKPTKYDTHWIERHLQDILRKVLTEAQRRQLVEAVDVEMGTRLPDLKRIEPDSLDHTTVPASEVRRVIERCLSREARRNEGPLREHYQTAHALYVMTAVRRELGDVLSRLARQYPQSIVGAVPASVAPLGAEYWHYPAIAQAPHPAFVVKNFRPGDQSELASDAGTAVSDVDRAALRQRRPRVPFKRERFEESIRKALGSTPVMGTQSLTKEETIRNISEWVLWALAGQDVVRSSQLSTLTAAVLRRCSPMAYLRWVTLGKELTVNEIFDEGCALLSTPSPPLIFDPLSSPASITTRLH